MIVKRLSARHRRNSIHPDKKSDTGDRELHCEVVTVKSTNEDVIPFLVSDLNIIMVRGSHKNKIKRCE